MVKATWRRVRIAGPDANAFFKNRQRQLVFSTRTEVTTQWWRAGRETKRGAYGTELRGLRPRRAHP